MSKTEKNYVEKKENRFLIIMKRLSRNPNAMFGMILLAVLVAGVILVPAISPYEYSKMDVRAINQGPSAAHWFGTDDMGRDLLTRIFYGGAVFLKHQYHRGSVFHYHWNDHRCSSRVFRRYFRYHHHALSGCDTGNSQYIAYYHYFRSSGRGAG